MVPEKPDYNMEVIKNPLYPPLKRNYHLEDEVDNLQNRLNLIPLPEEVYFMSSLPVSFDYSMCFIIIILGLFITIFSSFLPIKTIFDNKVSNLLKN